MLVVESLEFDCKRVFSGFDIAKEFDGSCESSEFNCKVGFSILDIAKEFAGSVDWFTWNNTKQEYKTKTESIMIFNRLAKRLICERFSKIDADLFAKLDDIFWEVEKRRKLNQMRQQETFVAQYFYTAYRFICYT